MTKTFPSVGRRKDGSDFSGKMGEIYKSFQYFNDESQCFERKKVMKLSGGDPLKCNPFPLCRKYLLEALKNKEIYKYPPAAGDEYYRKIISEYLMKEGFNGGRNLTIDNVIITMSTTHGFKIVLDVIARPYDVILMPSPCYGLFAFFPERVNAFTEFIDLEEEDNYLVNPQKLDLKIQEINRKLEAKYKGKLEYIPKVVGFLNQNPHNPTGRVMGDGKLGLINKISKVCFENSVYVIDDLVYRDLTFNNIPATPIGVESKYFNNTISLMGLSKCYGYASVRAGMVVASAEIISKIRNIIFQEMDSLPVLQSAMLAGAFNATKLRSKRHMKYFSRLNKEYEYRFLLLKCLVDGYDSLKEVKIYNFDLTTLEHKINRDLRKYSGLYRNNSKNILNGINGVSTLKKLQVEGGFFMLLDFSELRGKIGCDKKVIDDDRDIFKYLLSEGGIKIIMGSTIGFGSSELIGRVTFALESSEIIMYFEKLKMLVEKIV